jgi:phosphomethylpyrimidine synthase
MQDDELTKARAALNWEKHFELSFDPDTARAYHDEDLDVDTDFCAMCGHDWCSVRISKEIVDDEQRRILEERGNLPPEVLHKLASKGKDGEKLACHSDYVDDDTAKRLQEDQVVQLDTRPAHGLSKNDSVI